MVNDRKVNKSKIFMIAIGCLLVIGVVAWIFINNSKEKDYEIIEATKNWVKKMNLQISDTQIIKFSELLNAGYTFEVSEDCKKHSYVSVSKDSKGKLQYDVEMVCNTNELTISLVGDKEIKLEYGEEYKEFGASASYDNEDVTSNIITDISELDVTKLGTYKVTYKVSVDGEKKEVIRTVKVVDNVLPEIALNGNRKVIVYIGKTYTESGYVATDNYDKDITDKVKVIGTVDTSKVGQYTLTYEVSDTSGNKASIERTVEVTNEQSTPTLSLKGSSTIYLEYPVGYVEDGYTASDLKDGNINNKVTVSGTVNTNVLGTYKITYSVTNSSGKTVSVVRTVIVRDTVKPTISLNGNDHIILSLGETYIESGATASDNYDGGITSKIVKTGYVDINTVGKQYITYEVSDTSGNKTSVQRTIEVKDTVAPIISVVESSTTISYGTSYSLLTGITATDDYDGDITSRIEVSSSPTFNKDVAGTYTITYNVKDSSNNVAVTKSKTVIVVLEFPDTSGASAPVMSSNLIPVKWNGTTWVKADSSNPTNENQWYNYDKKIWANAVVVSGTSFLTYQSAEVGTAIVESDVLVYLVWIPRYSYSIPATSIGTNNPSEITISFENKTTPKSNGSGQDGSKLTHPAFTFDGTELSGIWVAKFETTGSISSIKSKPNQSSVRTQTISAMFDATIAMTALSNIYGFPTLGVDTHISKNVEWGAVAYLSHSKYGQNTEITKNNSSTYITGCAGDTIYDAVYAGCENTYDTESGWKASSTGNIYGIYDLHGGAYEIVMGNYNDLVLNSGFDSSWFAANEKYYDKYTVTNPLDTYNSGIKGDSLYETNAWHENPTTFVNTARPWFLRGGYHSSGTSGVFAYQSHDGAALGDRTWRIIVISE